MNEIFARMSRYAPYYNPLTGESFYKEDDAFESWRQTMLDHYRGLGLLDEPDVEEEIDFSAPEWNNLVLN